MLIDIRYVLGVLAALLLFAYFTRHMWKAWVVVQISKQSVDIVGRHLHIGNLGLSHAEMGHLASWFSSVGAKFVEHTEEGVVLELPLNMEVEFMLERIEAKLLGIAGLQTETKRLGNNVTFLSSDKPCLMVTAK